MARSVPWQRVGADAGLGTVSGSKAVAKSRTSKLSLELGASIVEIPESMGRTFASASPQNTKRGLSMVRPPAFNQAYAIIVVNGATSVAG